MGLINRTMDASEQKEAIRITMPVAATGLDFMSAPLERACTITDCKVTGLGISGAPTMLLKGLRFIAGTGGSSFAIGSTMAITAFGTSGYMSFSLPATGSSQLALQKGDMLVVTTGGANAAFTGAIMEVVVQNSQDIKTWY